MSAQPFIAQAQAEGDVFGAVAQAADQYAMTRYKVLVENQLNEALLGADEALRTRSEELVKSRDYRKALDGEDPIWERESQEMRARLRDSVGRDVYALQQFDARFNQAELQTRFRMRSEIDRRMAAEAAAARAQALMRFEQNIATGVDVAAADLAAREIGINSERWANAGAGNTFALEQQEYEALRRGTYGALENLADTSMSPISAIDNVRRALRDNDPAAAGPEGLYAYALLRRLKPEDQARLLRGVGGTFDFLEGPTREEEAQRRMAAAAGVTAGQQADALRNQLSNGIPVSQEAIGSVRDQLESVASAMTPEEFVAASRRIEDLEFISGISQVLRRTADINAIDNTINNVRQFGIQDDGVSGVDTDRERMTLDYLEAYRSNMARALQEDPMSWVRQTGAIGDVPNVDISAGAIQSGETGIQNRVAFADQVRSFYGLPAPIVFGTQDAQNIVAQINPAQFELSLGQLGLLKSQLGEYADIGINELQRAGLAPELVEAMYVDNPLIQRELVELVGVETADLKTNVEFPRDITTELNTLMRDYFIAFEAGGGGAAVATAAQQFAVAERLALSRARRSSESAAQIARGVIRDLLPPRENWVTSNNQLFIVPRNSNANEVQLAADRMMAPDALRQAGLAALDNPLFPDYVDAEVSIAALSSRGIWLNNSMGDGIVLHYQFGEGQYLPAMRTDGQPYELLFSDAASMAQDERRRRETELFQGMMIAP
jgi:hypothetical protein